MTEDELNSITRGDVLAWQVNAECRPDEQTMLNIMERLIDERIHASIEASELRKELEALRKAYAELKGKN